MRLSIKEYSQKNGSKCCVLVVGGGIVGSAILRDLSLQGIPAVLVDKFDFSSQTSQSSSKMLHGGIRYLENFDFKLVWDALHEKNLWLNLVPHLAQEKPFYLPVYKNSKRPLWMIKIGLFLYDILSSFQNSPHMIKSVKESTQDIQGLNSKGLRGCGVYYDAVIDDSKLTLEVLYDALAHGAYAFNYTELINITPNEKSSLVVLKDQFTKDETTLECKQVIFATGPFSDFLLNKFPSLPWKNHLLPSKGSHLWIKKEELPLKNSMLLQTNDNRVVFIIPQRNSVLVGTTERPALKEELEMKQPVTPSEEEIDYLLAIVKKYFPKFKATRDCIQSSFAGIRPLVQEEGQNRGETSRDHKIFYPRHNVRVILGGKYTTFRLMAQDIAKEVCLTLGVSYNPLISKSHLTKPSSVSSFPLPNITKQNVLKAAREELVCTFEDLAFRRLSLPSRKHWTKEDNFDQFFLELLPELQKYFPITQEDILNYP